MVQVYCKNTKETKRFPEGTSLAQMLSEFDCKSPYPIVSAKVNNVSQGLKFRVYNNRDIEFTVCHTADAVFFIDKSRIIGMMIRHVFKQMPKAGKTHKYT